MVNKILRCDFIKKPQHNAMTALKCTPIYYDSFRDLLLEDLSNKNIAKLGLSGFSPELAADVWLQKIPEESYEQ